MPCTMYDQEHYDHYLVGLAGPFEEHVIREHLRNGCEHCVESIQRGNELWHDYALAHELKGVLPNNRPLRRRILASVDRPHVWNWERAAAAVLLVGTASGFMAWHVVFVEPVHPETAKLVPVEQSSPHVSPLTSIPQATAAAPARPDQGRIAELEQQIAALRNSASTLTAELEDSKTRAGKLQEDLESSNLALSAAKRSRTELDAKWTELNARFQTAAAAEAKLAKYELDIQDRDREVLRLERVVSSQQSQLHKQLRAVAMLSSPSLELIRLRGTESGGAAQAHAFIANRSQLQFFASNLPALPAGRVYQLWLIRKESPAVTSGGIFGNEQTAGPLLQLADARLLDGLTALAITEEPAGGSPLPTGRKLLIGTGGRS